MEQGCMSQYQGYQFTRIKPPIDELHDKITEGAYRHRITPKNLEYFYKSQGWWWQQNNR